MSCSIQLFLKGLDISVWVICRPLAGRHQRRNPRNVRSPPQEVLVVVVLLLLRQCSEHISSPLLGDQLVVVLVLPLDALQPVVAITVRVDAITQPCVDLLGGLGLPIRLIVV